MRSVEIVVYLDDKEKSCFGKKLVVKPQSCLSEIKNGINVLTHSLNKFLHEEAEKDRKEINDAEL